MSGIGHYATATVAISLGVGLGAEVKALKATAGSEGLRDWTIRWKEDEEMVLVGATSAGAAAMHEMRPCTSESATEGMGGGEATTV